MSILNVLIIDDEQIFRNEVSEFLRKKKFQVFEASKPSQGFYFIEKHSIDIVILDVNLPEQNGIDVLKKIKEKQPEIEVIMITGAGSIRTVIDAFRLGAFDFFPKPFKLVNVQASIERTRKFIALKQTLSKANANLALTQNELYSRKGTKIIGKSDSIKNILALMNKIAQAPDTSVLITGESGTGKELIARGIHLLSSRTKEMFFDVNCSAVPENLFESEFFGHIKGSFTGANNNKTGWFELANNGTLFLDEIGDLQPNLQTKLLRVLEEKKIRKIGASQETPIDVRIIAATNKDLNKEIEAGNFRNDLFYRFSAFHIHLPPLRERKEDICLIANDFIQRFSKNLKRTAPKLSEDSKNQLRNYHFPGNIRELRNMIERAIILCDGDTLVPAHFPIKNKDTAPSAHEFDLQKIVNETEKRVILRAINATNGNKAETIRLLNITRQSFLRRLKKYNIEF